MNRPIAVPKSLEQAPGGATQRAILGKITDSGTPLEWRGLAANVGFPGK